MKLFDYRCETGVVFERFVKDDEKQVRCDCGLLANRIITPIRFKLEGMSGDFPTAADKWAREHEIGAKKKANS